MHTRRLTKYSRKTREGRRIRRLKPYTVLRCPLNGFQVGFCRELCTPINGRGLCGRFATHGMLGKTQRAILRYKQAAEAARASQAESTESPDSSSA